MRSPLFPFYRPILLASAGLLLTGGVGAAALQASSTASSVRHAATAPRGDAHASSASMPASTAGMDMSGAMPGMDMPGHRKDGKGTSRPISITQLTGPRTAAHVRTFTLTARPARLRLGPGAVVDAWTYDGSAPGPTLHVRQGDLVVVHLVNHLPVPTTIHWHGVAVPAAEDGVAGMTQDAVAPGQTYTYRFVARDAGTYWYHAHQDSLTQVARGLFGALVVAPAHAASHDDVDTPIALHTWTIGGKDALTANGSIGALHIPARPGAWVRLRLVNTDNAMHLATLSGAPFTVAALDGHALHGPQPLAGILTPIAAAGRDDVRVRVPAHGAVGVYAANLADDRDPHGLIDRRLIAVVGAGSAPPFPADASQKGLFDFSRYGTPQPGALARFRHADVTYTLRLGARGGFSLKNPGTVYTINGQAAPAVPPIMVSEGQVVRLHIVNETPYTHPIHLHGRTFAVLRRDGRPLTGSPVLLDTLDVLPDESYDVAFVANNPGVWMLHCHNLYHARFGMMMMVMYRGVTTPFKPGGPHGNVAD